MLRVPHLQNVWHSLLSMYWFQLPLVLHWGSLKFESNYLTPP